MKLNRFAKYAWFALVFNLLVIVWGAYVRASSSGAGCGSHWPLCNGEVIPSSPTVKTIVEYSHRLSSGVALILVFVMLIWAFRAYGRKHQLGVSAALAMLFMLMEAAIGAGLVLFEYVAENKSIARALWMSGHLTNTFLLVAMLSATAWGATTSERPNLRWRGAINWLLAAAIIGALILGVSGAVTALGGTLFPVTSLAEGLKQDLSPTAHVLIRLRFFHPFIAVAIGAYLILTAWIVQTWRPGQWTRRLAGALAAFVLIQLGAGLVNLLFHAPVWMQLVHLLLSDLIWIALILLSFTVLAQPAREPSIGVIQTARTG